MEAPVSIITGAASGIGRSLAVALHQEGHQVVGADLSEAGLASLQKSLLVDPDRFWSMPCDVTRRESWQALLDEVQQRYGRIDYLLNVAGYLRPGYTHEVDFEEIDRHLDVNTKGVIYGSKLVAERMVAQGKGHIINIASLAGLTPAPGLPLYVASKFAVRGFSLTLAQELAPHGVHVTVVCPDAVRTPMLDLQADYPEAAVTFSGDKVLTPEEVARLILRKVIPGKPWEITLPRMRGFTARLVGFAPGLARWLAAPIIQKGRRRQLRYKK